MDKPHFDLDAAHEYFSVACFNKAWELLEKSDRSTEEDEQMVRLSMTSHWHWTQREDCAPQNISVSYWQTSRIYAVLEQGENARRYAQKCIEVSQGDDVPPFYLGYAYEALARAAQVIGDQKEMKKYLEEANRVAELIADPEAKKWLLDDLESIK